MNRTVLAAFLAIALAGPLAPAWAREAGNKALQQDMEALRQEQQALRKDLDDIKQMLKARPGVAPAVQPFDQVVDIGDAPVKGNREARLTLVEFSDYQCPFCKRHAESTFPQIDKEYIATGKLRYVFRDFPLATIHANAQKASEAAKCAGDQGKYWEMHDRLFANQQALEPEKLMEHAQAIALAAEPFKQCLDSGKYTEKVQKDMALAQTLGISATPTLLLGVSDGDQVKDIRILRGAYPFAIFKQEIDKLLAGGGEEPRKIGQK